MAHITVESIRNLEQLITFRGRQLRADEPTEAGGDAAGPTPYELLLSALGACTAMTLLLYARRKNIPLTKVIVGLQESRIHAEDCADCETKGGHITEIRRQIRLEGPLSEQQRARSLEIAQKCPVHRTLSSEIKIRDSLVG